MKKETLSLDIKSVPLTREMIFIYDFTMASRDVTGRRGPSAETTEPSAEEPKIYKFTLSKNSNEPSTIRSHDHFKGLMIIAWDAWERFSPSVSYLQFAIYIMPAPLPLIRVMKK